MIHTIHNTYYFFENESVLNIAEEDLKRKSDK